MYDKVHCRLDFCQHCRRCKLDVRGTCLILTRYRLDFDRHCNVDDVKKEEEDTQCSPMCPATVGQHHDVENVDDVNRK